MTEFALCASDLFSSSSCSTGKERDTESGNDYFDARYYASAMGRFMSPDWSAKIEPVPYAKLDDPQSLNLYSYVENNPLDRIDADGHEVGFTYGNGPDIDLSRPWRFLKGAVKGFASLTFMQDCGASQGCRPLPSAPQPHGLAEMAGFIAGPLLVNPEAAIVRGSVWDLAPIARGMAIESRLAATEYASWGHIGAELGGKSAMFDFVKGNTLASLKTIDTTGTSWLKNTQATIRSLADSGAEIGGKPANIALDIRVQPGGSKAAQPLIDYGTKRGVTVTIKEYH